MPPSRRRLVEVMAWFLPRPPAPMLGRWCHPEYDARCDAMRKVDLNTIDHGVAYGEKEREEKGEKEEKKKKEKGTGSGEEEKGKKKEKEEKGKKERKGREGKRGRALGRADASRRAQRVWEVGYCWFPFTSSSSITTFLLN